MCIENRYLAFKQTSLIQNKLLILSLENTVQKTFNKNNLNLLSLSTLDINLTIPFFTWFKAAL